MNKKQLQLIESHVIPIYNSIDSDIYIQHILSVKRFAKQLVTQCYRDTGLDMQVYEATALLHDTGLQFGDNEHTFKSVEIALDLLKDIKCNPIEQQKIIAMIRTHTGPFRQGYNRSQQILRSADGMAHIANFTYLMKVYLHKHKTYGRAQKNTREKIEYDLEEKITLPEAKKMIDKDYLLAKYFLK